MLQLKKKIKSVTWFNRKFPPKIFVKSPEIRFKVTQDTLRLCDDSHRLTRLSRLLPESGERQLHVLVPGGFRGLPLRAQPADVRRLTVLPRREMLGEGQWPQLHVRVSPRLHRTQLREESGQVHVASLC